MVHKYEPGLFLRNGRYTRDIPDRVVKSVPLDHPRLKDFHFCERCGAWTPRHPPTGLWSEGGTPEDEARAMKSDNPVECRACGLATRLPAFKDGRPYWWIMCMTCAEYSWSSDFYSCYGEEKMCICDDEGMRDLIARELKVLNG